MEKYKVPRIAFINKMDRVGADFSAAIESMKKRLDAKAKAIFLPIIEENDGEETFTGMIDLVKMEAVFFDPEDSSGNSFHIESISEDLLENAEFERESLIETLADCDESLAEKYLEGETIEADFLQSVIRKATIALDFCPVIPGTAFKNKGVQALLDAVVNYLPCPLDLPAIEAEDLNGKAVSVVPDDQAKLSGLAFKLMNDSYVGKLVFFRIYSGTLKKGMALLNPRTGKTERIARLLIMKADAREDIEVAHSGDICGIVGLRDVVTGDTLCEKAILCVWSHRHFQKQLYLCLLNRRQLPIKINLSRASIDYRKKTQLLFQRMRILTNLNFREWVNCTWKSFVIVFSENLKFKQKRAVHKLLTGKPLEIQHLEKGDSFVKP